MNSLILLPLIVAVMVAIFVGWFHPKSQRSIAVWIVLSSLIISACLLPAMKMESVTAFAPHSWRISHLPFLLFIGGSLSAGLLLIAVLTIKIIKSPTESLSKFRLITASKGVCISLVISLLIAFAYLPLVGTSFFSVMATSFGFSFGVYATYVVLNEDTLYLQSLFTHALLGERLSPDESATLTQTLSKIRTGLLCPSNDLHLINSSAHIANATISLNSSEHENNESVRDEAPPPGWIEGERFNQTQLEAENIRSYLLLKEYEQSNDTSALEETVTFRTDQYLALARENEAFNQARYGLKFLAFSAPMKQALYQISREKTYSSPLFIQGEEGTEKMEIATAALQLRGCRNIITFDLSESADEGSLLHNLNELEHLPDSSVGIILMHAELLSRSQWKDILHFFGASMRHKSSVLIGTCFPKFLTSALPQNALVTIPPLRERERDILFLAVKHISDASAQLNKKISALSIEAVLDLCNHTWPGNNDELATSCRLAVAKTPHDTINTLMPVASSGSRIS